MKPFAIIAALALSTAAQAERTDARVNFIAVAVNSLPASVPVSCHIEEVRVKEYRGEVVVEAFEEGEQAFRNELAFRYVVRGHKAKQVRRAEVKTVKAGWFPKCALVLQ